ncbi:MAG: hypothetical protein NTV97_05075 [Alphaproteobacteria bacterium]|nr:hypothetical protein [Alphaproteobacteria bacterium]
MSAALQERLLMVCLFFLLTGIAAYLLGGSQVLEIRCDALGFDVCLRPTGII